MEQVLQSIVTVGHVILAGSLPSCRERLSGWSCWVPFWRSGSLSGAISSGGKDVYRRLRSGDKAA